MIAKKTQNRLARKAAQEKKRYQDAFCSSVSQYGVTENDKTYIKFSFQHLQDEYSFDSKNCDHQLRQDLLSKLKTISCQDWRELELRNKKGGFESIPKSILQTSLPNIPQLNGINKLHVLRFNSQSARIIGYRAGEIYYILYIDPNLQLYKHD